MKIEMLGWLDDTKKELIAFDFLVEDVYEMFPSRLNVILDEIVSPAIRLYNNPEFSSRDWVYVTEEDYAFIVKQKGLSIYMGEKLTELMERAKEDFVNHHNSVTRVTCNVIDGRILILELVEELYHTIYARDVEIYIWDGIEFRDLYEHYHCDLEWLGANFTETRPKGKRP